MEITVNADEAYYLTSALKHAVKRVQKHARKMAKMPPPSKGPHMLSERDARWLQALLDEVQRKTPPPEVG